MRSTGLGDCFYCGTENTAVVVPAQISEFFELLVSAYKRDDQGNVLVEWFREDWGLFRHPRMDNNRASDLLAEILSDSELVAQTFSPAYEVDGSPLDEWEKLRDELMFHNRFFPDARIDLIWLERLLVSLSVDSSEVPSVWYRARIQSEEAPYSLAQMGAPPSKFASYGRANPAGIPYLYLGSTESTAISEIRPHTGEIACVVDFRIPVDLELIDLRRPRRPISPFFLEDGADICKLRGYLPLLDRLGEELTRPVLPRSAAIDYTPSQYLCEFIKKSGYQGVLYSSSVGAGMNLALFDPRCANAGVVTQYRVVRVSVEIESKGAWQRAVQLSHRKSLSLVASDNAR
jgi:hypothetical protein